MASRLKISAKPIGESPPIRKVRASIGSGLWGSRSDTHDGQANTMSGGETETLDLRGLKCPLPALVARRHLDRTRPGGGIVVLTDDPMAPIDIPHMCTNEGFEVIAVERNG